MHWQQTCFECLHMNLTDVSELFQSEWDLWLAGVKGEMYVYAASKNLAASRANVCVTARMAVSLCPTLRRQCAPAIQKSGKCISWNDTVKPPLAAHNIWWTAANDWNNPNTGVYWTAGITGSQACQLRKREIPSSKKKEQCFTEARILTTLKWHHFLEMPISKKKKNTGNFLVTLDLKELK